MANTSPSIADVLGRPCIADTSVLSPLVQTGCFHLLEGLLAEPLRLGPSVLDEEEEIALPGFPALTNEPLSELLAPLYVHGKNFARHAPRVPHIAAFALAAHTDWEPVLPTEAERSLGIRLSSKPIRDAVREVCPDRPFTRPLDSGEAEALAIAAMREWTILVDDQAAVTAARCLYPGVPVVRLCALLIEAIQSGLVSCNDASRLYDQDMKRDLGVRSHLKIDCHPPRCSASS